MTTISPLDEPSARGASYLSWQVSSFRGLFVRGLWRVPYWRGIGALLSRHRNVCRHGDSETLCLVGGPPWCRNLDYAGVVKCGLRRIEIGIGPGANQLR